MLRSAIAVLFLGSGLAAQAWVPANMPGNTGSPAVVGFTPLAGFPYPPSAGAPNPPGQPLPASACPHVRQGGIFGFSDGRGTDDPNDDQEYLLLGRSDGMFLVHATPLVPAGQGVSNATIPADRSYSWLEDRWWGYLGPAIAGSPVPPNPPLGSNGGYEMDCGLHNTLNGVLEATACGTPPLLASAYCAPAQTQELAYTTNQTSNREVTALYDTATDRHYAFAINTWRPGIWVVALERMTTGPHAGLLMIPESADFWYDRSVAADAPDCCHHIYADQQHMRVWVTDDQNGSIRGYHLQPGNPNLLESVFDYTPRGDTVQFDVSGNRWVATTEQLIAPHDAMPSGDKLFISYQAAVMVGGTTANAVPGSRVDIVDLNDLSAPVEKVYTPAVTSAHSVYFNEYPGLAPSLWVVDEGSGNSFAAARLDRLPQGNNETVPWTLSRQINTCLGRDIDITSGPANSNRNFFVHNLRGVYRTGFVAQFHDGISLVDLNDGGEGPWEALSSYDTSPLNNNWFEFGVAPINTVQWLADRFLGAWDVFPRTDSGLIYVTGGGLPSPALRATQPFSLPGAGSVFDDHHAALVMRVEVGVVNRYGPATVFPADAAGSGGFPRIVNPFGPPRVSRPFIVVDENAGSYPLVSAAGTPLGYRYTICYSALEPTISTPQWTPTWGAAGNGTTFNLDPSQFTVWTNATLNSSQFVFPTLGNAEGQKWFFQMFVEEMDVSGEVPVATGRWSASRGHWLGVAR